MNGFGYVIGIGLVIIFGVLFILSIIYHIKETELLRQHQAEWNEIKENLMKNHYNHVCVSIEYEKYISKLPEHPIFGKCYPEK
jgi:predicted RND superfamily exporter protein